jgi:hypothetical protein
LSPTPRNPPAPAGSAKAVPDPAAAADAEPAAEAAGA